MSYTQVFGGTTLYPSDVSYLALTLNANKVLEWPLESNDPANPAARVIDVTTTGAYSLTLPDATQTGAGQTLFFNNLSASTNSFTLRDAAGGVVATIAVGEQWQAYLAGTATAAGTWRVFRFGASTATVQASALAGYGLTVTSNTLSQSMPVTTFNTGPRTVLATDRASALVWNGTGTGTLNLLSAATAGNNFFIAVRNSGGGDLTVDAAGSETIDGTATLLLRPGESTNILTDGLTWYTLGLGQDAVFAFDYTSITVTGGTYTLAGSELNRIAYKFVGTLTADQYIVVPPTVQQYWVDNATTGPFNFYLQTSGGVPIAVTQGSRGIYYCNGSNMVDADTSTVSLPVSVANGGTGITSYTVGDLLYANSATTLAKLSDVAVGNVLLSGGVGTAPLWGKVDLTTAVANTLPVANGGTGATDAAAARANLGAGTVTSVAGTGTVNGITLTGTVTGAGSLTLGGTLGNVSLTAQVTGTLPVANGGTGVTTSTGSGAVVLSTSPTLVTPNLGTPSAGALTNCTGLPIVGGTTGTLTVARGGTGATSLTSGYLVKGNGTSAVSASVIYDDGTNIGIGTTTPATKLTVSNATAIDTRLTLGNSLSAVQIGVEAGGAAFFGAVNNYSLYFLTNNTERFRISATGGITSSNLADAVGYKGLPLNSQTASYTLALSDMGKMISITTGGVVIPANASVAFPVGTAIVLYNDSASTQTVSITTDTLRQSGTTNTGTRTLAAYGVATVTKVSTTVWVISGNVS